MNLPTPASTLTPAERLHATPCRLRGRKPGKPCTGRGGHRTRRLGAGGQWQITRDNLKHVTGRLVVATRWCVVTDERAA